MSSSSELMPNKQITINQRNYLIETVSKYAPQNRKEELLTNLHQWLNQHEVIE